MIIYIWTKLESSEKEGEGTTELQRSLGKYGSTYNCN